MKVKTLYTLNLLMGGLAGSILLVYPFIAQEFNLSLTQVSLLKSIFNITGLVFAMPAFWLINKFSNKKLLFFGDMIAGLAFMALGFAPGFLVVMVYRVIWSMFMATRTPIIKSEISRIIPDGKKGQVLGNLGSMSEIGKVLLATLCGYLIIWVGWRLSVIWLGGTVAIIVLIIILISRNEYYKDPHLSTAKINIRTVFKNPALNWAYICSMLDTFASTSIPVFLPFLILFYKYDIWYLPVTNLLMLVGSIVGRSLLGGFADKKRPGIIFALSELVMGLMALLLGLSSNIIIIMLAVFGIGLVTKGTSPVTSVMIINSTNKDDSKKSVFTVDLILSNVAGMISATFFGMVGDFSGLPTMFIMFFIASVIVGKRL